MEKVKQALGFLKRNWYAAYLTGVCVLIATEVVGPWAGWGGPFAAGMGALIVYMIKNRIK